MSRAVSARLLLLVVAVPGLLAAGSPGDGAPGRAAWSRVSAGLEEAVFVRSVDRCGPGALVAATWPEGSRDSESRGAAVWVIELGRRSPRRVLGGVHAWAVAEDPDGGFWVLPRAGDELLRYTREGRRVERLRLPVRGQLIRRRGATLLLAQFPFRARGPLLWKKTGEGFSPWTGAIDPGSGDLASMIRRNTVVVAAAGGTVVLARPFVGPGLEILDDSGTPVGRITVPLDGPGPEDEELEPVFPLRDMVLVEGRIFCLLRRAPGAGAPGPRESLLVVSLSGGIEGTVPAPVGAARLAAGPQGEVFAVDGHLAVYRLRESGP